MKKETADDYGEMQPFCFLHLFKPKDPSYKLHMLSENDLLIKFTSYNKCIMFIKRKISGAGNMGDISVCPCRIFCEPEMLEKLNLGPMRWLSRYRWLLPDN